VSHLPPQDAIAYSQPLVKEITEIGTIELFKDENLMLLLKFLRESPGYMSVEELEALFRKTGKKKSDKSIYRYLKRLEDAGLVVQAGKRVFPKDKKRLKTQTLYMRTAKVFLPIAKPDEETCKDDPQKEKMIQAAGFIIGKHLSASLTSVQCLDEFITRIRLRETEIGQRIFRDADDEIAGLVGGLDWDHINSLLYVVTLLILLTEKADWHSEVLACFH